MTKLAPIPPLLVMRDGLTFWVETRPVAAWTATLQALREGCFTKSYCYDTNGDLWPIVDAQVARPPSLIERVIPWRTLLVRVTFGTPAPELVSNVAERIVKTMETEGHDYGALAQAEIRDRARTVTTPTELIRAMAAY